MTAIVTVPTNHAHYDAAMDAARLLGGNFKLIRERKRKLAVDLIRAAHVEDFALEPLLNDMRESMGFGKLASDEKMQVQRFQSDIRTISGAWLKLTDAVKASFLKGEIVFSTLAKTIKDAVKAADKADAEASAKAAAVEEAGSHAEADTAPKAKPLPPMVDAMRALALWIDETPLDKMDPMQAVALSNLCDAVDEWRAAQAKDVTQRTLAA